MADKEKDLPIKYDTQGRPYRDLCTADPVPPVLQELRDTFDGAQQPAQMPAQINSDLVALAREEGRRDACEGNDKDVFGFETEAEKQAYLAGYAETSE